MRIMAQRIETFTSEDYVAALKRVEPTDSQWEMLRIHLAAPDHIITARQLAFALGFANWSAANLHYGKFAGKLCKEMCVSLNTNLWVLVEFSKLSCSEWELHLRQPVIEALRELGIGRGDNRLFQEELGVEHPLVEGTSFTVKVSVFERNPVARQKCIAYYGTNCFVCGFSFSAAYGRYAENYIHIHHLIPLASIGKQYIINPITDLRPVCANCHSVIHLRQPPYGIAEIKSMLSFHNIDSSAK